MGVWSVLDIFFLQNNQYIRGIKCDNVLNMEKRIEKSLNPYDFLFEYSYLL